MRTVRTLLILTAATAVSCKGEPTTSYCEALCDWAVPCHEADRDIDADQRYADCLAATEAQDDSCAKASSGEINAATRKLLETCVSAIEAEASAGTCDPFTGRIDDIKQGTTPKDCVSQGADAQKTFEAARGATAETSDELCDRFTADFCGKTADCITADLGEIPDSVVTAMGGTPYELCVQRLDPVYTSECKADALYENPADVLDEPNVPREAARECLRDFSVMECDAVFSGSGMDPECAGSFSDNDQLLAVAGAMATLSQDVADAMGQ